MENNIQQTDQLHSVSPTASYSPSKTFIILMAILLILTVGVGGYILGANQNQIVQNQTSQVNQISRPSSTPIDETANWKTYTNMKRGYSFKYPQYFTLVTQDLFSGQTVTEKDAIVKLEYLEAGKKYVFLIDPFGGRDYFGYDVETKNVIFDGKKFTRNIFSKNNKPSLLFFIPDDKSVKFNDIEIQLPPINSEKYIILFDQILSTFKFTD